MITLNMRWTIEFFSVKVKKEALGLPFGIRAKFLHILELMEIGGPDLGMPHTKAMGGGLFEIRAKGREGIGRIFYCVLVGSRIVVLHSFVKKTNRTPLREIEVAQKRMKEVVKS